jgi:hypothetical protein
MCFCLDIEDKVKIFICKKKPQDSIELLFDEQVLPDDHYLFLKKFIKKKIRFFSYLLSK